MHTPEHWPRLEADNQAELLAYFGASPLAERSATAGLTWVITGVGSNDHNGVIWARLPDPAADQAIADVVGRFRARGLPALWQLDPRSRPLDLARRLAAAGCERLAPGVAMAADLSAIDLATPPVPDLTVEQVADAAGLSAWMDVWMTIDDDEREPREQLYASLGLRPDQPLRHYLARLNGAPVAITQLFLAREAAGLYCVTTHPDFRRRGIGAAIVAATLAEARRAGCQVAVLGPTPESQRLYARLGFELFPSGFDAYVL